MARRFQKISSAILFGILLLLFPSLVFSDAVFYFYDDNGRLFKAVADTGETAVYNYDRVGNLVSINSETTDPAPPVGKGSWCC